jgi:hypothetical protein
MSASTLGRCFASPVDFHQPGLDPRVQAAKSCSPRNPERRIEQLQPFLPHNAGGGIDFPCCIIRLSRLQSGEGRLARIEERV